VSLTSKKIISQKVNLQSTKSKLDMEYKRIINDINNNDIQIKNFEYEIKKRENNNNDSHLREKISSNKNQKSESFIDDYKTEQLSLEKEIQNFEMNLKNFKNEEKVNQEKFQKILQDFSTIIPESNLLLDLLKEEFKNNFNFSKIKNLLNKLKN
jgi:hypothetical protein